MYLPRSFRRENYALTVAVLFLGVVEYLLGLCGKGNLMLDAGLHMVGGDLPDGGFKVDLIPGCFPSLAAT